MEENIAFQASTNESTSNLSQPKNIKNQSDIRMLNFILMLVGIFTIPFVGHILWATMMDQYRLGTVYRLIIAILSYLFGFIIMLVGLFGNIDTSGAIAFEAFIPGMIIFLVPFIYTFIKPYSRKAQIVI